VIKYQKIIKTQFNRVVKKWCIDKGKEYSLNKLSELAKDLGQIVELTTLYNPEQDGTLERLIGIICERIQTVIINMNIPQFLWPLIFELMILIIN
jgi:hypothetical protein